MQEDVQEDDQLQGVPIHRGELLLQADDGTVQDRAKGKETEVRIMMQVNNLPEYARDRKWIVATLDGDEFWFFGAYDDIRTAVDAAKEVDGVAIPGSDVA